MLQLLEKYDVKRHQYGLYKAGYKGGLGEKVTPPPLKNPLIITPLWISTSLNPANKILCECEMYGGETG